MLYVNDSKVKDPYKISIIPQNVFGFSTLETTENDTEGERGGLNESKKFSYLENDGNNFNMTIDQQLLSIPQFCLKKVMLFFNHTRRKTKFENSAHETVTNFSKFMRNMKF